MLTKYLYYLKLKQRIQGHMTGGSGINHRECDWDIADRLGSYMCPGGFFLEV